jgi:hypothetical protein
MKIVKLRPDFELIWIDSSVAGTDGYGQNLYDHILNENGFRNEGVLMVLRRRKSKENNDILTNATDTYPRRCILRMVDESTHETRLTVLRAMQAYLIRPEFNKFGYEYVINDASDLTPPDDSELELMDHYIPDAQIVNIMLAVLEDTGDTWFHNNEEHALDYFSGPTFPLYAIQTLGYPERIHMPGNVETYVTPVPNIYYVLTFQYEKVFNNECLCFFNVLFSQ